MARTTTAKPPAGNTLPRDDDGTVAFRKALLLFFDARRRDLPWRRTSDPYRILVSEIMLQQTRVETVVPYYRRWVERFPDVRALADAEEEEVLRFWQGLGYYRRARALRMAARETVARWGGSLPEDADGLRSLPGVGAYTAGAVASIAFGEPVPAVDGNVRRVFSRLMDDPDPSVARLRDEVMALLDPVRPGDFNQALMELGALICTPRSPKCDGCPIAAWCGARAAGTVDERPRPPTRRRVPRVVEAVVVAIRRGSVGPPPTDRPTDSSAEVLLRRRPSGGLLGGMWECPGVRLDGEECSDEMVLDAARALAEELMPGDATFDGALPTVEHRFTHLEVEYRPVGFRCGRGVSADDASAEEDEARGDDGTETPVLRWVPFTGLASVPLPRAQTKILEMAGPAIP